MIVVMNTDEFNWEIWHVASQNGISENWSQLQSENKELKSWNVALKYEVEELKSKVSKQGEKILLLETKIIKQEPFGPHPEPAEPCTKMVKNSASKRNENSSPRTFPLLPRSCEGLRKEGHFANGVYIPGDKRGNQ